jgi:hypothetical protein
MLFPVEKKCHVLFHEKNALEITETQQAIFRDRCRHLQLMELNSPTYLNPPSVLMHRPCWQT